MSSTSILKTGGSARKPTSDNNNKKIDSKFSTMNKFIETKVNKVGDKMSGNLDMSNNRIMNVGEPEAEFDAISKNYCQGYFSYAGNLLKNDIVSWIESNQSEIINNMVRINRDKMEGALDMTGHSVYNVNFPNNELDAINLKFLKILYLNKYENINIKKLMSICRLLNDLIGVHSKTLRVHLIDYSD